MPRKKPHPILPEAVLTPLAARFRALGDPSRLALVNRLMDGELPVQDLMRETGLSQTNLSRHLGVLRQVGIVERRSDGNRAFYQIGDPKLVEVCEIMCGSLADRLADDLEQFEGAGI
ncbi:MAG: winged helix-turn-helix transcriptional regulator [Deltaproteobacteria bacterium]|nr:winged helix-turn-helix transcriptional regulator [Deltaproteobacteria bacterium]